MKFIHRKRSTNALANRIEKETIGCCTQKAVRNEWCLLFVEQKKDPNVSMYEEIDKEWQETVEEVQEEEYKNVF